MAGVALKPLYNAGDGVNIGYTLKVRFGTLGVSSRVQVCLCLALRAEELGGVLLLGLLSDKHPQAKARMVTIAMDRKIVIASAPRYAIS